MGYRYDFTVDINEFPEVPKILAMVGPYGRKLNRSRFINQAIREYYQRRKPYLDKFQGSDDDFDKLELLSESLLPSIGEPVSSFRFEDNPHLYYFMTDEMRSHIARVQHTLADGLDKSGRRFKGGFHSRERTAFLKKCVEDDMQDEQFPTEADRHNALTQLCIQKLEDEESRQIDYIRQQAMKPSRDAKTWRKLRIEELREELRTLTTMEEERQHKSRNILGQEAPPPETSNEINNNKEVVT